MGILMDAIVFFAFIACVLFVGFFKSRKTRRSEASAEDYFLAGRGLKWWIIGFSLIAANISAEQFVGMSGQGAGLEGISCASWEWTAAITLVVVAFCFLPYFLRTGITTMPEFIEMRFNHVARTLMTLSMIGILVVASLIGVTYAGSLVMWQLFNEFGISVGFSACCVIMSCIAGAYVLFGGLKACAWADLIQGAALIVGGAIIAWIACRALGDATVATSFAEHGREIALDPEMGFLDRFNLLNEPKMHMGPANTTAMTWTVLIMGIWIPHFYYWGLNQYITQRLLGSGSLAEGQKGIVLAAALKLLIPFIIVIPGVIAFNLFAPDMAGLQAQKVRQAIEVTEGRADHRGIRILRDDRPDVAPYGIFKHHRIHDYDIGPFEFHSDFRRISKIRQHTRNTELPEIGEYGFESPRHQDRGQQQGYFLSVYDIHHFPASRTNFLSRRSTIGTSTLSSISVWWCRSSSR